jgi:hypothetical protein
VCQAVVLVAVVIVSHLPAFLHGAGADDGAEGHGERDDDHSEWFHHLDGLGISVVRAGGSLLEMTGSCGSNSMSL